MSEENLKIWNELKQVPKEAKKKITGGRLKGLTDIKPQWRLQMMTEQFGPIGIGWYYEATDRWIEDHAGEVSVYVSIQMYIKTDSEWSKPIFGIGGSKVVAKESSGPHHSDEAYKMATTDALSVAMKQLGVAADVYMGLSDSKYDKQEEKPTQPQQNGNRQPFDEYKKSEKVMTTNQKSTLKDLIVKLDKIGSSSCQQAVIAINELLGHEIVTFDYALKLIKKCNLTVEKGS